MTITKIALMTVPVSDQDQAKEFYTDRLGFAVVRDAVVGPMRWLEVAPGDGSATVALLPGMPGLAPGSVRGVQLATDDLDTDCESLRGAGVSVDGPNRRPWGREAAFADPDGNTFVLISADPVAGG